MAEEFGFDQRGGHGGAVDGDEGAVAARRVLVDGLGDEFLARARFAEDQHGGKGLGGAADELEYALHLRAAADDGGEREFFVEAVLQFADFAGFVALADHVLQHDQQRLRDRSAWSCSGRRRPDGFDGGGHRAVAGDHQEHGFGLFELPVFEQVHPRNVAHLQIGQDEVDGLIDIAMALSAESAVATW